MEVLKHPLKSGAGETGFGVVTAAAGVIHANPLVIGVGFSLITHGVDRMTNYTAGIRYPRLTAG